MSNGNTTMKLFPCDHVRILFSWKIRHSVSLTRFLSVYLHTYIVGGPNLVSFIGFTATTSKHLISLKPPDNRLLSNCNIIFNCQYTV